jgi:hypothetical protein
MIDTGRVGFNEYNLLHSLEIWFISKSDGLSQVC